MISSTQPDPYSTRCPTIDCMMLPYMCARSGLTAWNHMQLVKTIKTGICPKFMSIHWESKHLSLIIIFHLQLGQKREVCWQPGGVCVCVWESWWRKFCRDQLKTRGSSHPRAMSTYRVHVSHLWLQSRANGMGQHEDYKAAWCFHWGLPCWVTWSQLPLSAVNPLNPAEEPIHKCVTHPGGAFCAE